MESLLKVLYIDPYLGLGILHTESHKCRKAKRHGHVKETAPSPKLLGTEPLACYSADIKVIKCKQKVAVFEFQRLSVLTRKDYCLQNERPATDAA